MFSKYISPIYSRRFFHLNTGININRSKNADAYIKNYRLNITASTWNSSSSNNNDSIKKVLDKGFIKLVDYYPKSDSPLKADIGIVRAARVSYGKGTKTVNSDRSLIRYLMRNDHTSPFEMVVLLFHIKCPLWLARQLMRHRTASINEISGRYSILEDEFYIPENIYSQSENNKQCSGTVIPDDILLRQFQKDCSSDDVYQKYKEYLCRGISREHARMILPLNIYTEFYWQMNLHNLLHFIKLRAHPHAQKEIQDYANALLELIREICPISAQAFLDYNMNSIKLSSLEIEAIKSRTTTLSSATGKKMNAREQREYDHKLEILGLDF